MNLLRIFKLKNLIRAILNPHLVLILLSYNFKRFLSDFFGKYNYKYNIIFIAGLPLSATTLVKNMFGLIPGYFTRYTPMPYDVFTNQNIVDSAFKYCPKKGYTLFKTHLNPFEKNINIIRKNNVQKVIVTYRDLRDVAISEYHRRVEWPKKKSEPLYADYRTMKKEDAINNIISLQAKYDVPWIKGWFDISEKYKNFVYFCQFEILRSFPERELSKMLKFYELTISQEKISEIVEKTKGKGKMIKNMKKSAVLPWALSTNFRSGGVGYWKKEFTEKNKIHFKNLIGTFIIELGYEKNNDW